MRAALLALALIPALLFAQTTPISQMPAATLPLTGDLVPLVQPCGTTPTGYCNVQTAVSNIGGAGGVTVTGSPVSGELTKFSGASSITNGNLTGDCSTTNTLSVTCLQTNGTNFGTFATQNYATPPAIGGTTPAAGTFTTGLFNNVTLAASQSASGNGFYNAIAGNQVNISVNGASVGDFTATGLNSTPIGSTTAAAATFTTFASKGTATINASQNSTTSIGTGSTTSTVSIGGGSNVILIGSPQKSNGTAFTVASGTGACATTSTLAGGPTSGHFTCTGSTGASTVTLTLITNAGTAEVCYGRDVTTPTTVTQTGAESVTSVTLTLTSVTANDVISFGCPIGY